MWRIILPAALALPSLQVRMSLLIGLVGHRRAASGFFWREWLFARFASKQSPNPSFRTPQRPNPLQFVCKHRGGARDVVANRWMNHITWRSVTLPPFYPICLNKNAFRKTASSHPCLLNPTRGIARAGAGTRAKAGATPPKCESGDKNTPTITALVELLSGGRGVTRPVS